MLEDVEGSGSSFSPRLAVNYLFNPQHSLRAVYSEAVRSPGMYENDVDWRYRVRHLTPAPYGQRKPTTSPAPTAPATWARNTPVRARSASNGFFRETGLAVDVRLFHEEITGLISDPLSVVDFSPDNGDRIRFSGAEGQLDWRLGLRDRLRATYAYLDYDATSRYDRRLTARHGGSAGWMHDWGQGWSSAPSIMATTRSMDIVSNASTCAWPSAFPWARPPWNWPACSSSVSTTNR
ncbi:TonB-dependent receptor [Pseudomonas aeruginosa]|nr:TonB-dependent receptor [Pseudomonas aeruginosa]